MSAITTSDQRYGWPPASSSSVYTTDGAACASPPCYSTSEAKRQQPSSEVQLFMQCINRLPTHDRYRVGAVLDVQETRVFLILFGEYVGSLYKRHGGTIDQLYRNGQFQRDLDLLVTVHKVDTRLNGSLWNVVSRDRVLQEIVVEFDDNDNDSGVTEASSELNPMFESPGSAAAAEVTQSSLGQPIGMLTGLSSDVSSIASQSSTVKSPPSQQSAVKHPPSRRSTSSSSQGIGLPVADHASSRSSNSSSTELVYPVKPKLPRSLSRQAVPLTQLPANQYTRAALPCGANEGYSTGRPAYAANRPILKMSQQPQLFKAVSNRDDNDDGDDDDDDDDDDDQSRHIGFAPRNKVFQFDTRERVGDKRMVTIDSAKMARPARVPPRTLFKQFWTNNVKKSTNLACQENVDPRYGPSVGDVVTHHDPRVSIR